MSLHRHFLTTPSRFLSVFSFVAAFRPRTAAPASCHLSDAILSDIGVSRCLLQAGFCQASFAD